MVMGAVVGWVGSAMGQGSREVVVGHMMPGHALHTHVAVAFAFAGLPAAGQAEQTRPAAGRRPGATSAGGSKADGSGAGAAKSLPESIADQMKSGQSAPWAIVVGLTLLTLLPAMLLSMTPMVRLLVVFHFLRQALGTQTAPSNQILMGLALMMTWFLMQPVLLEVERTAVYAVPRRHDYGRGRRLGWESFR